MIANEEYEKEAVVIMFVYGMPGMTEDNHKIHQLHQV